MTYGNKRHVACFSRILLHAKQDKSGLALKQASSKGPQRRTHLMLAQHRGTMVLHVLASLIVPMEQSGIR